MIEYISGFSELINRFVSYRNASVHGMIYHMG